MFVFTDANIGGTKRESGEFFPYIFDIRKTRFSRGAPGLTSRQKRKNAARASERDPTTPHSRRGCQPSASPRRNNHKHLPPKKRPCCAPSGRDAYRSTLGESPVTAGRFGAAAAYDDDPRATHPQPAPGRGRRRNASSTPRQRRRGRADAKKRRRGARKNDPTSEACVTRRPFQASQRWS